MHGVSYRNPIPPKMHHQAVRCVDMQGEKYFNWIVSYVNHNKQKWFILNQDICINTGQSSTCNLCKKWKNEAAYCLRTTKTTFSKKQPYCNFLATTGSTHGVRRNDLSLLIHLHCSPPPELCRVGIRDIQMQFIGA